MKENGWKLLLFHHYRYAYGSAQTDRSHMAAQSTVRTTCVHIDTYSHAALDSPVSPPLDIPRLRIPLLHLLAFPFAVTMDKTDI